MEEQHQQPRPDRPDAGSAAATDGDAALPEWPQLPAPMGDPAVDQVVAQLAALVDLPVTEQAAAYGKLHEQLAAVLDGEAADPGNAADPENAAASGNGPVASTDASPRPGLPGPGPALRPGVRPVPGPVPGPKPGSPFAGGR